MKKMSRYDELMEEVKDIGVLINEALHKLLEVKWDSNTLKSEIEELFKEREAIFDELDKMSVSYSKGPNYDEVKTNED